MRRITGAFAGSGKREQTMKAVLMIEDTTKGIYPELRWQSNGVLDHLPESLAMHLMNYFIQHMKELESKGLLVVHDISSTKDSS